MSVLSRRPVPVAPGALQRSSRPSRQRPRFKVTPISWDWSAGAPSGSCAGPRRAAMSERRLRDTRGNSDAIPAAASVHVFAFHYPTHRFCLWFGLCLVLSSALLGVILLFLFTPGVNVNVNAAAVCATVSPAGSVGVGCGGVSVTRATAAAASAPGRSAAAAMVASISSAVTCCAVLGLPPFEHTATRRCHVNCATATGAPQTPWPFIAHVPSVCPSVCPSVHHTQRRLRGPL